MQMFQNLPWYTYIILGVFAISYIYRFIKKGKEVINGEEPELFNAKFRKSKTASLTYNRLFSISLDAVITEYWKIKTNTLEFDKVQNFDNYLQGWGIDTRERYWNLTNYFIEDGRRWYFNFINSMMQNEPEEKWDNMMMNKFGTNERATRYLQLLKSGTTVKILKEKGFITFDSEIEKGVAAYDASILVGHARRAYSAGLISQDEAWKVIEIATKLAKDNFSSWEEFGKSHILGFSLDIRQKFNKGYKEEYYHLYKQVLENPNSPWQTIDW